MHLRLLFYSRIGQLCRERKALLRHMADEQDVGANIGLDDVSVRLSEVSDLAEQLRANGADEYRTYMQFSSAFSRGVSLPYPPNKTNSNKQEGGGTRKFYSIEEIVISQLQVLLVGSLCSDLLQLLW